MSRSGRAASHTLCNTLTVPCRHVFAEQCRLLRIYGYQRSSFPWYAQTVVFGQEPIEWAFTGVDGRVDKASVSLSICGVSSGLHCISVIVVFWIIEGRPPCCFENV